MNDEAPSWPFHTTNSQLLRKYINVSFLKLYEKSGNEKREKTLADMNIWENNREMNAVSLIYILAFKKNWVKIV